MLSEGLRLELQVYVQQFIGVGPSYDALAELIGHVEAGNVGGPTASAATRVIDLSLRQSTPDLFVKVVTKVIAGGQGPDLAALVAELQADPGRWVAADSLQDLWVPDRQPFVDRTDLRALVMGAAAPAGQGPPAITIEAPPGHGKQTMSDYITHVAKRLGAVEPVARVLEPGPDPGLLDVLVADVRWALGLPLAGPTTHEEPDRKAEVLAHALAQEARFAKGRVWLIAYLVRPTELEPGVLRFVDELLDVVQRDELTAKHLRVTVLTESTQASGLTNLPPPTARFVLPEVDAEAVMQWLAEAVPGKPPALYAAATDSILEKLEARGAPESRRLEWLARHCAEAHQYLLQEV